MTAIDAFKQRSLALRPDARALAFAARGLAAPACLDPRGATILLGRKSCLEFWRRLRKIAPKIVLASTQTSVQACGRQKGKGMLRRCEARGNSLFRMPFDECNNVEYDLEKNTWRLLRSPL